MSDQSTNSPLFPPLPPDDPRRELVIARPEEDGSLPHIGIVGDTYTILLSGTDTAGSYCLIDMLIPPGGGPPLHRHDFEESFILLEGDLEFHFRDEKASVHGGETVHIPANAPHQFRNASERPARLLCICSPAGAEELFAVLGTPLPSRTSPAPQLDAVARAAFMAKGLALAPKYKSQFLPTES